MRDHQAKPAPSPFLGWKASLPTPAAGAETQEKDSPQSEAFFTTPPQPRSRYPGPAHPTPEKLKFYSHSSNNKEEGTEEVSFVALGEWDELFLPRVLCSPLPPAQEGSLHAEKTPRHPHTLAAGRASDCPGTGCSQPSASHTRVLCSLAALSSHHTRRPCVSRPNASQPPLPHFQSEKGDKRCSYLVMNNPESTWERTAHGKKKKESKKLVRPG